MSMKKINSSIHIALLNQQHDAEKDASKKEKEHTLSRKFCGAQIHHFDHMAWASAEIHGEIL